MFAFEFFGVLWKSLLCSSSLKTSINCEIKIIHITRAETLESSKWILFNQMLLNGFNFLRTSKNFRSCELKKISRKSKGFEFILKEALCQNKENKESRSLSYSEGREIAWGSENIFISENRFIYGGLSSFLEGFVVKSLKSKYTREKQIRKFWVVFPHIDRYLDSFWIYFE